ncbi:MAG: hypothetical protein ACHQM6_10130, partial [Candidatus Kapaibacterium sp.]
DEADFASIGFRRTRAEGIKINKIASQLDALRRRLSQVDVLQVTACTNCMGVVFRQSSENAAVCGATNIQLPTGYAMPIPQK